MTVDGRQSLLHAAAEAFARDGFTGASVGAIAKVAGVTQPLVNHHFGSKKGLFQAVLDEQFSLLEQALQRCEDDTRQAPELERLKALIRTYVVFSGEHPHLGRILRLESHSAIAREVNQRWQRRFAAFVEARLARAAAQGVLGPVPAPFLFFALVGIAVELFSQPDLAQSTFGLDVTAPETIAAAAEFACHFILKGAGASPT